MTATEDLIARLKDSANDKDNFPRMDSEKWLPVGLAREAASALSGILRERDEAAGYAERLAVSLWEKHWRDDAPQWSPLTGDLIGILTQIDNSVAGLSRATAAEAQLATMRIALTQISTIARAALAVKEPHGE